MPGASLEIRGGLLLGRLPKRLILRRRYAVDSERQHILRPDRRGNTSALQLLQEPRAVLFGRRPQRVIGLHTQHQVHAPLEVEPQLELPVEQPLRGGQSEAGRQHRIDAHPEEEDEDKKNRGEFPLQVRHDRQLVRSATGSCP